MKYYNSYDSIFSVTVEEADHSTLNTLFSERHNALKNNFNYDEISSLAKDLHASSLKLKNVVFFTNPTEAFEHLYPVRFVLTEQEFCEFQEYLFIYSRRKGISEIVPHLESFLNHIFEESEGMKIPEAYKIAVYKHFKLANDSETEDFFNNPDNIGFIKEKDYKILHDYTDKMQPFFEFIQFAKHVVSVNYFKLFLKNPEFVQSSELFSYFLKDFNLNENTNPRISEFTLLVKLMEQQHWDHLAKFKHEDGFYDLLESLFFFPIPRPNSQSMIPSSLKNVHLFHYTLLEEINNKNIDLDCLFSKNHPLNSFESFVFKTSDKILNLHVKQSFVHDPDGLEHLRVLLKNQNYLHLNNKFTPKGILIKNIKI